MTKKKLILIDAMASIYRAYFAFIKNPRINSKGQNISAIFGFVNSLIEILEKEKPTHIAVAFDSHEPTARTDSFTEYKANRDKQPEDITFSIPLIKQILKAMDIPVLEIAGYEADDIIATLTKQIPYEEYDTYMFTPDKDFAQLVNEHVFLYKPSGRDKSAEIWDKDRVLKEFRIKRVDQVIEIQGLMGDSVDNIPGVPGIGPKTAQELISTFDNIENLLKNLDKLKGKVRERLEEHAEQALMSRELARLLTDAPLSFNEEEFVLGNWKNDKLKNIFAELEFRALIKRIFGEETATPKADVHGQLSINFGGAETTKQNSMKKEFKRTELTSSNLPVLLKVSLAQGRISLSFSFDNCDPYRANIQNIAFAIDDKEAYFLNSDANFNIAKGLPDDLIKLLEDKSIVKCGYDLKFYIIALKKYGIHLSPPFQDVIIMHYLIDPEVTHDFNRLTETYMGQLVGEDNILTEKSSMEEVCERAVLNIGLSDQFMQRLSDMDMKSLYHDIEEPLIKVLADMEYTGVKINEPELSIMSEQLGKELSDLEKRIHNLSGISFNVNSPQQLGHVLFDILKLDPSAKKTKKSSQYSTGEEVLTKLAEKHEIARVMLEYRSLQKLRSTYVDALPILVNKTTGRIHTTYDQSVTATGRLSSKNPNLQNIPIRTERGRLIRKAFIPTATDRLIVSADYSQIELRVIAHLSGDKNMTEAFKNKIDIHAATAAKVFNVALDTVKPEMRRKAKEVNFGIIYGISAWGLSQRLDIPKTEGASIIEQYYASFPDILLYIKDCIDRARKMGYAETLFKRRRYLRDINSRNAMMRAFAERNAVNAPVQGSAADIIKMAMNNIHAILTGNGMNSRMIMQVHDELVFDVKKDELSKLEEIVRKEMQTAVNLNVPLVVDVGKGENWLEAH